LTADIRAHQVADLAYIVVLRSQAGKSDMLGAALAEMLGCTRQEPGCTICELHQSSEDPTTWMVYERWRDQESFARHMEQPHTVRFVERMGDLIRDPADVRPFKHHA
jgi:quinol monooxygenase YgiN